MKFLSQQQQINQEEITFVGRKQLFLKKKKKNKKAVDGATAKLHYILPNNSQHPSWELFVLEGRDLTTLVVYHWSTF